MAEDFLFSAGEFEIFRRVLCVLGVLLLGIGSSSAASSPKRYQWKIFTASDSGLPYDRVTALATGTDGAVWVGTGGGLARLQDGALEVYTASDSGLPDDGVTALATEVDGTLWVGTLGGLARLQDGKWEVYTVADSGLPDDRVTALATGAYGVLWVGTVGGLVRLQDGALEVYTAVDSELPADGVWALATGADGALWVATGRSLESAPEPLARLVNGGGGLVRLKDGAWEVYTAADSGLPYDFVDVLATGTDGALWVGTGSGLARLYEGTWEVYTLENSGLPSHEVMALAIGTDGALWVGTDSGLAQLQDGKWEVYTVADSGLPYDRVTALATRANGALWVGTADGLARVREDVWELYSPKESSLLANSVFALATGADGALWVSLWDVSLAGRTVGGHDGAGLARLKDGVWEGYTAADSGLPRDDVWALASEQDGILWVGTGGGLARLREGAWEVYTAADSGLPQDRVTALATGVDGALWVGTDGGLARLQDGKWEVYTAADSGLPYDRVTALATRANGALWVGTGRGLARLYEGTWEVYTRENSELPDDHVVALAIGADGALWVGTTWGELARLQDGAWEVSPGPDSVCALATSVDGALWGGAVQHPPGSLMYGAGLARLKEGAWQERYTRENSGLPSDNVQALATGADGALWVGTLNGLARFNWGDMPRPRLLKIEAPELIGQKQNTFAVRAFDPDYRSEQSHFRYHWVIGKRGMLHLEFIKKHTTRSPYYTASFPGEGKYTVTATVIDRYGRTSDPAVFDIEVDEPEPQPWLESFKLAGGAMGALSVVYLIALWPLLLLYPHVSWARTAVNSGALSRFPLVHKSLLSTRWARRRVFWHYAVRATQGEEIAHYMSQAVRPAGGGDPFPLVRAENPMGELRAMGRYLLVLGRSGTGKSVLLRRLHRHEASRFRGGFGSDLPVFIDAPTHLRHADLAGALKSALIREGNVELPNHILDFMIRKGGFLIFVDSLNEEPDIAEALRPFLNNDSYNTVLMASQVDMLRREDVVSFGMVEVSPEQAEAYLNAAVGPNSWNALPEALRSLARNPQDLALIADVAARLGPANLPSRRAALYAAKVEDDSAFRKWVEVADPRLDVVYALAFRMLGERRVLDEPTLAAWVREALAERELDPDEVGTVTEVIRRSRLFGEAVAHDRLGRPQPVLDFDHELTGAFLAAKHVRSSLTGPEREAMLDLAEQEGWQNVFFFVVDELPATMLPGALLDELLACDGEVRLRIVAYAIETKRDEDPPLPGHIEHAYASAKLQQDVQCTPAAWRQPG